VLPRLPRTGFAPMGAMRRLFRPNALRTLRTFNVIARPSKMLGVTDPRTTCFIASPLASLGCSPSLAGAGKVRRCLCAPPRLCSPAGLGGGVRNLPGPLVYASERAVNTSRARAGASASRDDEKILLYRIAALQAASEMLQPDLMKGA
jgi:hypothetical protein